MKKYLVFYLFDFFLQIFKIIYFENFYLKIIIFDKNFQYLHYY